MQKTDSAFVDRLTPNQNWAVWTRGYRRACSTLVRDAACLSGSWSALGSSTTGAIISWDKNMSDLPSLGGQRAPQSLPAT
jgi:hypothetical protein